MNIEDGKKIKSLFKTIVFIGFILLIVLNFNVVLNIFGTIYAVISP
ncbi:MAG: hypothetical protein K0Q97_3113, partial [Bacillota bacterium]|nr:hypothetical protein [Bacillota bacterium]